MSERKLDELATDVDDASIIVEELQADPDVETTDKLEELREALEHASDTIEKIENDDD